MAGNLQADNSGNILCEFDYNNIIVVDPNRTIDATGKIQERLVDPEKLVMFANLEAELLPRTKLAVGAAPNDRIRTISVAKMNFLKPTKNSYLGTGYYDELTGENTTQFKGQNQMMTYVAIPQNGDKPYVVDAPLDKNNILDNGLLGITQINIQTNSSFIPSVKIELEDVQGRALFQLGNNSPYAAFFNLPYPPFYLTLKGYYGQAIRYQLNLEKFNARFNSFSGNYQISLEFKGYKFNVLNEISLGHLIALPHMYTNTFSIAASPVDAQTSSKTAESQSKTQNVSLANNNVSQTNVVGELTTEKGYQKILEVYSEYKAKALIPPDFPELTLVQLMNNLENFEKNIANSFTKAEVEPLTNIRNYKITLQRYFDSIRGTNNSWFVKYLNPRPLILNNEEKVYILKNLDLAGQTQAVTELSGLTIEYNRQLNENNTLGAGRPDQIKNPIKYKTFILSNATFNDIDWEKTTKFQLGLPSVTKEQINKVTSEYQSIILPRISVDSKGNLVNEKPVFFVFDGENRFDKQIALLDAQANKKLSFYENKITAKLAEKIEDRATGIGFKPTARNIIAVIMASAEGFLRLLDDVHTDAWNVKYDPVRKAAILSNTSSAPSTETIDLVETNPFTNLFNPIEQTLQPSQIPVYPWPQFFIESPEDKKGRFQLKYIGDPTVVDLTKGYLYDKWPEVEFVEEYIKGLTKKFDAPQATEPLANERDTNVITINAIEFPSAGLAYANKEEIKFFYEIWERQFLTSHYSGLNRANYNQIQDLIRLNVQTEVNNIYEAVNISAPYLSLKLKNYDINANNYISFLENISNSGTGRAYQDFIRDFFVTPYIKSITETPTVLLSTYDIGKIPQSNANSVALEKLIANATNEKLIVDTIPFTNPSWVSSNMSNGTNVDGNDVYITKNTLKVFDIRKVIANFSDIFDFETNRPVTNFSYTNYSNPSVGPNQLQDNFQNISTFYNTRKTTEFSTTEGIVYGTAPVSEFPFRTTTSLLNTPYFVNAIQNGTYNARRKYKYPYVQAAYLFLNSLPLASLREKYKTLNNNITSELDYIASCFNKFGAVHKLPYAWILKMGSVWHRYKTYKESGVDIIKSAWSDFNFLTNYSPVLTSTTQQYDFKYNNQDTSIILEKDSTDKVIINSGFFPKVINDFFYFYNTYDLYQNYTNAEIQKSIDGGMKLYKFPGSEIQAKQNDKDLTLNTWSVLVPDIEETLLDANCNKTNNTTSFEYYIIPSFGSKVNQTEYECINNPNSNNATTAIDLTGNTAMYNGSVRSLWSSPNFGYFDNNQIVMPPPDSYINEISPSTPDQSPFKLLTENKYSKIEEIFSVFEKKELDLFENEFLNFSKSLTDADVGQPEAQYDASTVNESASFKNFQSLFRTMMNVPGNLKDKTESEIFDYVVDAQFKNTQTLLKSFMEYDILLRIGNPSKYKRRIFDSYLSYLSTPVVVDPIPFEPYTTNTLPTKTGNITLQQSKLQNQAAWFALETEVGFSTIPNVEYTSTGSYITDFFVDSNIKFTVQNVALLSPLIKMYATAKLESPSLTASQFKNQLKAYLQNETEIQDNFINDVLAGVRLKLPNQQQLPERVITSAVSGEQSKIENYEIFKALNDKWVAGNDYKNQTLFEDILFLDKASRNIGETILLDIFDLKYMLNKESLNMAMSVFTFISGILIKNNFNVMNLPAYVNFYNIQNVDGTDIPQPEGSLEFANNMWGTYLDVDYRKSSPKMICFYAGKPSNYLDLPKGNFRFRDDGFDLRRASENPLLENQQGKKDWAVSNKCVGFNVDLGIRNQNVFYSFSVSQDNGVATSESINTQLNMIDQATGRNVATQNVGLYNLYKQRSYKATATCLGNALLQPTMYFNLRHVPMFNGPYMITDVQHAIQAGNFQTTFTGIRQGIFDLPAIDTYLQSINQNLLTKIEALLNIKKDAPTAINVTDQQKSNSVVQQNNNKADASNSCVANVDVSLYGDYTNVPTKISGITQQEFADKLLAVFPETDSNTEALRASIYVISYINSFQKNSNGKGNGQFKGWNNNFANISLSLNWNPSQQFFKKNYCCVNVSTSNPNGKSEPLVAFESVEDYLKFMGSRLKANVPRILQQGLFEYYVCNWPKTGSITKNYFDAHISDYDVLKTTIFGALNSAQSVGLLPKDTPSTNNISVEKLKQTIQDLINEIKSVQSGTTSFSATTCIPKITSFSPTAGNTGTIIQINGEHMDTITGLTICGVQVYKKDITYLNSGSLRTIVPKVGNGSVKTSGKIIVSNEFGSAVSTQLFTYNPAINSQTTTATNLNPQQTGINPLKPFTQTGINGGTTKLTVEVNLLAGAWEIEPQVQMSYVIKKIKQGPNNTIIETPTKEVTSIPFFGYVSNDKQKFEITESQMNAYLQSNVTPSDLLSDSKVYVQFTVTANALDKVKYPQPVVQNYNFLVNNLPPIYKNPGSWSKVYESNDVNIPNFDGENYYSIKKPTGGYITYQFNCPNLKSKETPKVYSIPTYQQQSIRIVGPDSNTRYTYIIEFENIGDFELSLSYQVNDKPNYTFTLGAPKFTLHS